MAKLKIKKLLTKFLSLLLIFFGVYHLLLSTVTLLFIYPKVMHSPEFVTLRTRESLVEKAFILYLTTIIDGLYGASLLVKPSRDIKAIHLLAGATIFIFSLFFIRRTQLTTDPLLLLLSVLFKRP